VYSWSTYPSHDFVTLCDQLESSHANFIGGSQ